MAPTEIHLRPCRKRPKRKHRHYGMAQAPKDTKARCEDRVALRMSVALASVKTDQG